MSLRQNHLTRTSAFCLAAILLPVLIAIAENASSISIFSLFARASAESGRDDLIDSTLAANGKVVYQQGPNASGQIFTITPGTGISTGIAAGSHPAYSPDGTRIAFVRNGAIMVMNADGTGARTLSTSRLGFTPTWSPDGSRLAYVRGDFSSVGNNGKGTLFITNMTGSDGSTETQLVTGTTLVSKPAWGASNRIAFGGLRPHPVAGFDVLGVCVSGAIPATPGEITANPPAISCISGTNTNDREPAWSPDGASLTFMSTRHHPMQTASEIYVSDANGQNARRVTETNDFKSQPTWSPDGLQIVYSRGGSQGSGNATLRSVSASGNGVTNPGIVTNFGSGDIFPNWGAGGAAASPTPTPPTVDLRMESIHTVNPVVQGDPYLYTFSVRNLSQTTATGVKIVFDPVPANIEPHPLQLNCTMIRTVTDPNFRRVTCTFGNIAGGSFSTDMQVSFINTAAGATAIRATVSSNETDPVPANNSGTWTTTIVAPGADLRVSMGSLNTETPSVDREFSYNVRLQNLGPSSSVNTILEIEIPTNSRMRPAEISGCSRVGSGRTFRCNLGSLPTGFDRLFPVKVKPLAPGTMAFGADVTPRDTTDPTPADQRASRTLQVTDVARPPNDNIGNAQPVTGPNLLAFGSNVNATLEPTNQTINSLGEVTHARTAGGKSVWYLWQAPSSRGGTARVTTAGSTFDTLLDVYEFSGSPLPVVGYNDDETPLVTSATSFRYRPGAAYYIAVDGYRGSSGNITLKLDATPFEVLEQYRILQKIIGFRPGSPCSEASNLNDPLCSPGRDSGGFLDLKVFGQNFTNQSKVVVNGQPPTGFDRAGNPVPVTTSFVSSTELNVRIPPRPSLQEIGIAQARVHTPVFINTGSVARPSQENYRAVALNIAQLGIRDLKNATLQPGETRTICGAKAFNKEGGETCIEFVHFGPGTITVQPTWFAALAFCRDIHTDTDLKLQCAENLSTGKAIAINPGPVPLGLIKLEGQILLPPDTILPQAKWLVGGAGAPLIGNDGSTLIGNDGGTLIGNDGSTLIGNDGSTLIGNDGGTLIGNDGSTLIGNDGSTLISDNGAILVGLDGGTGPDIFGIDWLSRGDQPEAEAVRPPMPRSPGDLGTGSTGFVVATGSGGSEPTVTITTDEVTGEAFATVSMVIDNTSSPKITSLSNVIFTLGLNPAVIKLQSSSITVNEGAGFAAVTVERTGDTSTPASFEYTTLQGSDVVSCATGGGNSGEKCDFNLTVGAVRFAANETSKEIRIPIVDDTYSEGNETVQLIIGNALGAAIQLPSAATITITDNDAVSGPGNPLDITNAQFLARQQYLDLLGREPSAAELSTGADPIAQCGGDLACRRTKTVDLSQTLITQSQPASAYVFRLYRAAFGNDQPFPITDASNLTEAKKWPNHSVVSRDRAMVKDGQDLVQTQKELASSFVLRPAFTRKYSPNLPDGAAFVDAVLASINTDSGVNLISQRTFLINEFDQAGGSMVGRAAVMYRLAEASITNPINNALFITAEDNRAFASTLHHSCLKRNGDVGGLNLMVTQLQSGSERRGFIDQFVTGAEYRLRFGPSTTQASVSVSGRVLTPSGLALRNVIVSLVTAQGVRQTATTSAFGLFSFANVPNGSTHTISIASKRYRFAPRVVPVNGDAALGDFVGLE